MYSLKLTNNYIKDVIFGPTTVQVNQTIEFPNIAGDIYGLTIPQVGIAYIRNLGETKISGYDFLTGQYGVLIRLKTTEAYYRFDGNGNIEITIDNLGICSVSTTNGTMIEIKLPELVIQ